jgi:hypothetical protein
VDVFGKTDINVFMLSLCYEGIAFPLLWQMLEKKGNCNQQERIDLMQGFIPLFGKGCINAIVADREFIGSRWLGYLQAERIPFHIRIQDNMWLTKAGGEQVKLSWLLQGRTL